MKIWSVVLWLATVIWAIEAIALFFDYQPNKPAIFIAFLITSLTMGGWARQAWSLKA